MGKTLVYVVLLGFLGFGVYYFLLRDSEGLYKEKDANFTFRDTGNIGKIFLVQNNGESILVERNETNNWIVNKQYPAMRIQIVNILTCLKLQSAFAPVAEREHDRVIKLLAGLGTKVEVYDRKGTKLRSFFVAGQGPNFHGSYMIIENSQHPYLVEIQGFEGYLTPRYSTDLNDWRSRLIFDSPADSIAGISVTYPSEQASSFSIKNDIGTPQILVKEELKSELKEPNTKRIKDYLDFFTNINAEGYLNGVEGLDSMVRNAQIRCKMVVTSKSGANTSLDIYWMDIKDKDKSLIDQTSTDPNHRPVDVERMYAINQNSKDTLLIQTRTFDKLLRRGYEFYQQKQPAGTR